MARLFLLLSLTLLPWAAGADPVTCTDFTGTYEGVDPRGRDVVLELHNKNNCKTLYRSFVYGEIKLSRDLLTDNIARAHHGAMYSVYWSGYVGAILRTHTVYMEKDEDEGTYRVRTLRSDLELLDSGDLRETFSSLDAEGNPIDEETFHYSRVE
jgi:hypothetical protein